MLRTTLVALALAALPQPWSSWADSAEGLLLTPAERRQFLRLGSAEEAERWVADFWARRDPDPETAANELREEVGRRAAAADASYGFAGTPGSLSDRGRVLVLLGPPQAAKTDPGTARIGSQGGSQRAAGGREIWFYARERLGVKVPAKQVHFVFVESRPGAGDYGLDRGEAANRLALVVLAGAPESLVRR
jgi:GWxTD domain-containing protein